MEPTAMCFASAPNFMHVTFPGHKRQQIKTRDNSLEEQSKNSMPKVNQLLGRYTKNTVGTPK